MSEFVHLDEVAEVEIGELEDGAGEEGQRLLAGGGRDVPEPVRDVLQVEGAADVRAAHPDDESITVWLFKCEEEPRRIDVGQIAQAVTVDENLVWIDLSSYAQDHLMHVAGLLDIRRFAVRETLSPWQRPRLDVSTNYFWLTVTLAQLDREAYRVQAGQLDLFVGHNFLVTAHKLPLPFTDRIMARAAHNPDLVRYDSAFMLYIILDELLEYYERMDEDIRIQIETLEERALVDTSEEFLADLLHFKRYSFALTQLVAHHSVVFKAFLRPDFSFGSDDSIRGHFRDLADRFAQLSDGLKAAQDAVNGAFNIYVSQVSHRTNRIIKVLTMVSTILLPATLIVGFFSTQFQGVSIYNRAGFIAMLATIAIVTTTILVVFRRTGWI